MDLIKDLHPQHHLSYASQSNLSCMCKSHHNCLDESQPTSVVLVLDQTCAFQVKLLDTPIYKPWFMSQCTERKWGG